MPPSDHDLQPEVTCDPFWGGPVMVGDGDKGERKMMR